MPSSVCRWVRSVLTAYLDGELKPSTREAVRRHLEHCRECRAYKESLEETWKALDAVPGPVLRPGFTGRMMARIVEERELAALESRLRPHRLRRRVLTVLSGLAAGILLGFCLYSWTGLMAEPVSPVEREVSRSVSFLEDADLLDEIAVVEAMDQWLGPAAPEEGV
jgi:anti-sigma factor RsiW